MIDIASLPISGGVIAAGVLWAALSGFVLGPLVAERSAERMNWCETCEQILVQDIKAGVPLTETKPVIGCDDVLGRLPQGYGKLFNAFGMDVACDALDRANAQKQQIENIRSERLAELADRAGDQCKCAVAHLIESKRWSMAIYAGSGRLIAPAVATNLNASLMASARSADCARLTGVGGGS